MSHPAVSLPMVDNSAWDVASVTRVFDSALRHRQLPTGVVGLQLSEPVAPDAQGWSVPMNELV
jgi:hypothetical protein